MRIYVWKFPAELQTHDHPDGPWQVAGGEMDRAGDGLGLRAPGGTYNRGVPPARPLVPCLVLLSYLTEAGRKKGPAETADPFSWG